MTRDLHPFRLLEGLVQDVRYGLRQLRRAPGFTAAAVLTLAIGIGANTALFSLLDAALFKRLPVPRPEQLVSVIVTTRTGWMSNVPSVLFEELRAAPRSFSGVFAFWQGTVDIRWDRDTERAMVQHVSGDYYSTLGVHAAHGRLIERADDTASGNVAVLGYDFWRRRLAADPAIVGKTVLVDGKPHIIIGVTPRWFFGTDRSVAPDITIPLASSRKLVNTWITARLRPDVSLEEARAETALAWQRALEILRPGYSRYRASERDELLSHGVNLMPADKAGGRLGMRSYVEPLRILILLSAAVLLIGCANIANLLIARGAARLPEIATRLAIGAGRGRVMRQLLVESVLLSGIGGALGIAFGFWAHRVLVYFLLGDVVPTGIEFVVDRRLLFFTLAISVATAVAFGFAPALRAARIDLVQVMKRDTSLSRLGFGRVLVVAQVAACVLLLIAGTLLARTLGNLRTLDRGFTGDDLVIVTVGRGENPYTGDRVAAFYRDIIARAEAVPGVVSASIGANALFGAGMWNTSIWVQGRPAEESQSAAFNVVAPGFFAATGMELLAGRDFSMHDRVNTPAVAIVNEAFARRYCPEGHPIGCRFGDRGPESSGKYEVIGMVKNAKYRTLREDAEPMIYEALLQEDRASSFTLHVRTKGNPRGVSSQLREELRRVDPTLPIRAARTIGQQIDESLRRDRMMATLSGFFALLALLLTCIGLVGIVAYGIERRKREIGIRIALGARRASVLRLVLNENLVLVSLGSALGVALALVSTRVLASLLFGLTPTDPATVAGVVLVVLVVGSLACYLPTRRATGLDPMIVLRRE